MCVSVGDSCQDGEQKYQQLGQMNHWPHPVAGHRQAPEDFLICLKAALSLAGGGEEETLFLLGF